MNAREGNKIVPVYSCDEARPRCLVYLLDTYFAKFPPKAVEMEIFTCIQKTASQSVWYDSAPVGRNKLKTLMEVMCCEAGIHEKKTNHSLRATGASVLFNAGVPEKLICDVTSVKCTAAL